MRDACSVSGGMAMVCATCAGDEVAQPVGAVREMVAQLKCKCPLTQRGCEWEGTVADVSQHLDQCAHLIVPCPYLQYGCEVVMKRLDNARHREVSKEWHTELMSLFLAGRVEQQAEMIEQLQLEVHTLTQGMKIMKYLKLNGIVWKIAEKDAITGILQELKGQAQAQYNPYNPMEPGYGHHDLDLPEWDDNLHTVIPGWNGNLLTGPQFFIDSFGIAYPQLSFETGDTVSLNVTNDVAVQLQNEGHYDGYPQQQQGRRQQQLLLLQQQQQQQQQLLQEAKDSVLPGTWEVVIVNNEDTEIPWKVEVGKVTVTSGQGFKLTNIPAGILLHKKYYHHQTMDIQILCKSD